MIKTFGFLFFMLIAQAFGHAFLSKGMVGIGELTAYSVREILFYALVVMRNPWIVFGGIFSCDRIFFMEVYPFFLEIKHGASTDVSVLYNDRLSGYLHARRAD